MGVGIYLNPTTVDIVVWSGVVEIDAGIGVVELDARNLMLGIGPLFGVDEAQVF